MWGLAGFLHPLWQWTDYIWVGIILWLLINQTIIFIVLADVIIQWITTICRPYLSNGTQWQYLLLTLKVSKFWPQRSFHELWGKREKIKNSFASWNRKEYMTLASQDVLPTASLGLWMWCTFFCITSFFFFKWHLLMDRGWRDWLIVKRLLSSLGKSSSQWGSPGLASHTSARPHIAFVLVSGWTGLGSPSLIDGKQNICLVDPGRS